MHMSLIKLSFIMFKQRTAFLVHLSNSILWPLFMACIINLQSSSKEATIHMF